MVNLIKKRIKSAKESYKYMVKSVPSIRYPFRRTMLRLRTQLETLESLLEKA